MGMRFDNSYVILYGANLDARLHIDCSQNSSGYCCIDAEESHFEVWEVGLTMVGKGSGFYGNAGKGVLEFINTHADIDCDGGAIVMFRSVYFDDAKVQTSDVTHNSNKGYVDGSGNLVKKLQIRPLLAVGNDAVRTTNSTDTGTGWRWSKTTKSLTLTGNINGYSFPGIANYGLSELTVITNGTAFVESAEDALVSYGDVSLTGSGTLKLSSSTSDALSCYDGTLTVKMQTLDANGKYYGVRADNLKLERYNDSFLYIFTGELTNVYAYNFEMDGVDFMGTNTYWHPTYHSVFKNDNKDCTATTPSGTRFRSSDQTSYYDLWIADLHVRTNNTKYLMSRYLKGNVTYNADTKTLTLDNVTLDYQGSETGYHGIKVDGMTGIKIEIKGNNTITGKDDLFAGLWMRAGADVELSGDGTLNLGGNYGAYPYSSALTVGDKVTLVVPKTLGSNGTTSSQYGNLTVKGHAVVKAQRIRGLNELSLQGDRAIVQPAGAAFSDNAIRLNGTLAEGVVIDKLETYDLRVNDAKVTNVNCADILGDGTMSYDNDSKTLSLNNVNVPNYDGTAGSFISNLGIDGLMIYVAGNNTINCRAAADVIYTNYGTHILGEGTLNSNSGIYIVSPNADNNTAAIYIEGPTVNLRRPLHGWNNTDAFQINSGKLTIITSDVPVYGIESFIIGEGLYITEPYGAWSSDLQGFTVDGSSLYHGNLVISDKEPDAVDGVKAAEDAPTGIYDIAGRRTEQTQRGINILRTTEGKARKVVVK